MSTAIGLVVLGLLTICFGWLYLTRHPDGKRYLAAFRAAGVRPAVAVAWLGALVLAIVLLRIGLGQLLH